MPKQTKGHYMGVVLSKDIRKEIEIISKREGRSLSNTIRMLLIEAIKQRLPII